MSDQSPHFSKSLKIEEAKVEYLPHEILIDIVLRLPIKSILTWTSVSKSWNSLIKNPNFISTHLSHTIHSYNHNLLLLRLCSKNLVESLMHADAETDEKEVYSLHCDNEAFDEYTRFDFPLPGLDPYKLFHVVGTCNGLVCLSFGELFCLSTYNLLVWNPCIRKYVTLPTPNLFPNSFGILDVCIGFGFDSKTNDYKVVTVATLMNKGVSTVVHVYSLATGEWKMITAVPPTCAELNNGLPAFVNGALHWSVSRSYSEFHPFVLAFDLGDEDLREIMLPKDILIDDDSFLSVSVCGESLAAFRRKHCPSRFHVWVMKEYGVLESWTKVLTVGPQGPGVDVSTIFDILIDELEELGPVGFRKNGEVVIETEEGKLVSMDSESRKIKDLRISGHGFTSVHPYVESLVLLDKSEDAVSY